jgi:FtsZ-interacting cell division protein ZipA
MSDLQLGLIVIAVAIVVAVVVFNRWQERQLRRRVEVGSQRQAHVDPVGQETHPEDRQQRVEPKLVDPGGQPESEAGLAPDTDTEIRVAPEAAERLDPTRDERAKSSIDYQCSLRADTAIAQEQIGEFLSAAHAIGKRVTIKGWSADTRGWVELPQADPHRITRISASLQLADRTGPVNRVQLATMRDLVQSFAQRTGAVCECPGIDTAAQAAAELDRFCAQVDISVGCNVVAKTGAGLLGTKVRGLLESAGYGLDADGKFWLRAEDSSILLCAADSQGKPLTAERLRTESLAGLTLSMDVPNVPANARVFDRMFETARHLAQALDAVVVDDNQVPLTDSGLKVIRQQLRAVQAAMEAHGIGAGSDLAARLFS